MKKNYYYKEILLYLHFKCAFLRTTNNICNFIHIFIKKFTTMLFNIHRNTLLSVLLVYEFIYLFHIHIQNKFIVLFINQFLQIFNLIIIFEIILSN